MAIPIQLVSLFLFLLVFATGTFSSVPSDPLDRPESYIIHMSKSDKPSASASHQHWYSSVLESLSTSSPNATKILYTYERAVNGFSARLTASQVAELRNVPGVLSVLPDELLEIQTTRSPYFLGLRPGSGLWPVTNYGENIIIGVIDSGIWPELSSFSDAGLSPVPTQWKGKCETGPDFPRCNRKIIGARAYHKGLQAVTGKPLEEAKESKSPRDTNGHGTHTASTAAGSAVPNASFYGYGRGIARGVAGKARIAVYKVCWSTGGCSQADILAAMDDAILDGVHVISFSIGQKSGLPLQYYQDNMAIGSFRAVQHGILFSCSAGNNGPGPYTTRNIAPWMLSVGASTINREFRADVVLGNGTVFTGKSLYAGKPLVNSKLPLVYGGDSGDSQCRSGKLIPSKVTGKIVICDSGGNGAVAKGIAVKSAGGVGMIVVNSAARGGGFAPYPYLLPATMVSHSDGNKIKAYVKSVPSLRATIVFKGTVIGTSPPAPRIASFSSRGPNNLTAEILKPDVIAPGVDILAGWTGANSPSELDSDPRRVKFNVISGTSMACPHVTGLAALLRKAHPKWTPAAIKSALMTTAYNKDSSGLNIKDSADGKTSTPFAHGSGHVDAFKASDPGLVYDMGERDYLAFLCAIGYNQKQIAVFLRGSGKVDCKKQSLSSPGDLNYPSFSVVFRPNRKVVQYNRVVTNVGSSVVSIYKVKVIAPRGVKVSVSPSELVFNKAKRRLSYKISFTSTVNVDHELGEFGVSPSQAFGSIEWSDGTHLVRSPIAVV